MKTQVDTITESLLGEGLINFLFGLQNAIMGYLGLIYMGKRTEGSLYHFQFIGNPLIWKECADFSVVDVHARLGVGIEDHLMKFYKSRVTAVGVVRGRLAFERHRNRLLIKAVLHAGAEKLQILQCIADLSIGEVF